MDYYPYGNLRLDKQTGFNEQRKFIGQEYDVDTGLSYLNARYLNGKMGRFVSQDPEAKDNPQKFLQDPQQLNYYSYARNNPITLSDPSGRCIGPLLAACAYAVVTAPTWVPAAITAVAGLGAAYATHEVASAAGSYSVGYQAAGDASINRAMTTFGVVGAGVTGLMSVEGAVAQTKLPSTTNDEKNTQLNSRQILDSWKNTTFPNKTQAIKYHLDKHGEGRTLSEYTKDGINFFNKNSSQAIQTKLYNGESGLKIKVPSENYYGIYSQSGQAVSHGPIKSTLPFLKNK